jgi:hypothetical protein
MLLYTERIWALAGRYSWQEKRSESSEPAYSCHLCCCYERPLVHCIVRSLAVQIEFVREFACIDTPRELKGVEDTPRHFLVLIGTMIVTLLPSDEHEKC